MSNIFKVKYGLEVANGLEIKDGGLTILDGSISLPNELRIGTSADAGRFPNTVVAVSNTSISTKPAELHNIGLLAEGTADSTDPTVYGIGVYGIGYTSGATLSSGIVGEGHVTDTTDTGSAVGVRGYSLDTHANGMNIGLHGNAANGLSNYALYMTAGDIGSLASQTWSLGGDLTFSGAHTVTIPSLVLSNALPVLSGGTGVTTSTGSGSVVLSDNASLVTPVLGNATATTINKVTITQPATGATITIANSKVLTVNNSLTFTGTDSSSVAFGAGGTVVYTTNKLSTLAVTSSTEFASVISDETGTGELVFANSPNLITPSLGDAIATTINKVAITPPASGSTITIADGKVLAVNNSLTFTGTDSSSVAFGAGGTVLYATNKLSDLASTSSSELAGVISDETGTGYLVFSNTPSLTSPVVATALTTTSTSFDLINTTATTVNLAGGATAISIGSSANAGSGLTTINHNLQVAGNITFNNGVTQISSTTLSVDDPLIYLANNNSGDLLDIGIFGAYNTGTHIHTGFARDATDKVWKLFSGIAAEPVGNVIDFTTAVYDNMKIGGLSATTGEFSSTVSGTQITSTVATGTAPFTVTSTTPVANLSIGGNAATVTTNANLTGVITSDGNATSIASQTGTGTKFVMDTSPELVTPTLGAATATSINNVTFTAPATGSTITVLDGKTLAVNNSLTFTGTDSSSVAFGAGGTVMYTTAKLSDLASTTSAELASIISDETGTGLLVFATSPALTTPDIGNATATSVNKVAITAPASNATLTLANGSTLATSGAYSITLTATADTNVTLPTTGTLLTNAVTSLPNLIEVGTISTGTWSASFGAVSGANLTNLTAGNLSGTIPSTVLANSSVYIGNTGILLNREAASLSLTGVDIDGSAGGLKTTSDPVIVSGAEAPIANQVLTATSSTTAEWKTPAATGVTSVGGTGTVNGLTLSGTVTTTGDLTLGGTLSVDLSTNTVTGTLPIAQGGTGVTESTGNGTKFVLDTSPALTTPNIDHATASSINKVAITAPANNATLTLADGSSLITVGDSNTLSFTTTGNTSVTLPVSGTLLTGSYSVNIGTSSVALNRASSTLSLSGVNIDGYAGALKTASGSVAIGSTAPTAGQVLTAINGTSASWQDPTGGGGGGTVGDTTGSGTKLMLSTSPTITTSLLTDSTSFDLLNTTATTLNIGGEATSINMGASGGTTTLAGNLVLAGTITYNGNVTLVNTSSVNVADPLMFLANNNTTDSVDIGITGKYNDGSDKYSGFVRDASDSGTWKLFNGCTVAPATTVDFANVSLAYAPLKIGGLTASTGTFSSTVSATKFNNVTLTAPTTGATLTLADNSTISTAGNFTTAGAYGITLTATAATNVTLPTSGTLVADDYTTTATSATTVTLSKTSTNIQVFTGTVAQTIILPTTVDLSVGKRYTIINNSTATLTIKVSGPADLVLQGPNTTATYAVVSTGAQTWSYAISPILPSGASLYGYTTTATSATAVTLTKSSTPTQVFTGSIAQTVKLPSTADLTLGKTINVINNSTVPLTIQTSGGTAIITQGPSTSAVYTVAATAAQTWVSAISPVDGNTITGLREKKVTMAAGTGTTTLDLLVANYFSKTISGATTFALAANSTAAALSVSSFILDLTDGGAGTITWWAGVKWVGGTAPTFTTSGRDVLGFFTHDGGTTWTGLVLGKDLK